MCRFEVSLCSTWLECCLATHIIIDIFANKRFLYEAISCAYLTQSYTHVAVVDRYIDPPIFMLNNSVSLYMTNFHYWLKIKLGYQNIYLATEIIIDYLFPFIFCVAI